MVGRVLGSGLLFLNSVLLVLAIIDCFWRASSSTLAIILVMADIFMGGEKLYAYCLEYNRLPDHV